MLKLKNAHSLHNTVYCFQMHYTIDSMRNGKMVLMFTNCATLSIQHYLLGCGKRILTMQQM